MKAIGANRTSGPEAILISTVRWWVSHHQLSKYVQDHLAKVGTENFNFKKDSLLGQALVETGLPVNKIQDNYWAYCKNNVFMKFMVELATREQKGNDRVKTTKDFVNNYILEYMGSLIKECK